ncbi:MAG TPA: hypothetical protein VK167_09460 [Flavipsychrobacter sp.]|nr:hypothetical protein [Flavipsychrobacter sp.]
MKIFRITIILIQFLIINKSFGESLIGKHYTQAITKIDYSNDEMHSFFNIIDSFSYQAYTNPDIKTNFTAVKDDSLYKSTIVSLLQSHNQYKRVVGIRLITLIEDRNFNQLLISSLSSYSNEYDIWAFIGLCKLSPTSTDIAIEWLIKHEDFGDAHAVPFYLQMDTISLLNTSYKYLNNKDNKAKVISLQTIATFDNSLKTDSLCRAAIVNWDLEIKGYAIHALGQCNQGKYKNLLAPYINKLNLNYTIKYVLEGSPTSEDVKFAKTIKTD